MTSAAFPDAAQCAHRFAFSAFGVGLGVQSNDEALLRRAREALPPGFVPAGHDVSAWFTLLRSTPSTEAPRHRLLLGDETLAEGVRVSPVIEALEDALRLQVASRTLTHLFVHAGVVRSSNGVIVLPGFSGGGKTTLVRALVDAGAEYWSDEYAVFDEAGLVWPYARRLSIRQGTHRRHRQAVGEMPGPRHPEPLSLLVITSYAADSTWNPRLLSAGERALGLLQHTLVARTRPAFALGVLSRAVERAKGLAGPRGDATTSARELLNADAVYR